MAHQVKLNSTKTYATPENAVKAVEKSPFAADTDCNNGLTYFIHRGEDGRYFPVFIGERAVQAMAHFHFTVVA